MTRDSLLAQIAGLDAAARVQNWRAHATIGVPATEAQIRHCEDALGITMPSAYVETLREWNGCAVELHEAPCGGEEHGRVRVQWFISELESIIASTENLREHMAQAMAGSDVAAAVAELMSQIVVIVDQDGSCVFISSADSGAADVTVRALKLEWALAQFPPIPRVIAASPNEYFEKSFRHLTETLETELYWW